MSKPQSIDPQPATRASDASVSSQAMTLIAMRTGKATGFVNPKTLDAVWYRQFSGASRLARGGKNSVLEFPIALILMTVQPEADQPSAETGADQSDTE